MLKFKETAKNNMVILTAKKNNFKYQIKENKEEIFCVIWDLKKDAAYNTKWDNIKFNNIKDAETWINNVDVSTLTYKD